MYTTLAQATDLAETTPVLSQELSDQNLEAEEGQADADNLNLQSLSQEDEQELAEEGAERKISAAKKKKYHKLAHSYYHASLHYFKLYKAARIHAYHSILKQRKTKHTAKLMWQKAWFHLKRARFHGLKASKSWSKMKYHREMAILE